MSTTMLNAEIALSKELSDFWSSTTTSAGASGGQTLVDTSLKAVSNDWITDEAWDMITSGTYGATGTQEERKITNLDNTTGTVTVLPHTGQIATSVTYRIHRLFQASEKRRALIAAARKIFPYCFTEVYDETLVSGNWLKDGSFERWTTSTNLTDWAETTSTVTQTATLPYYKHGAYSAKLSTAAGTLAQSITNFGDLQFLRGKTATFTIQGRCDTASCLRLSINDGTTQTYSSYHAGDDAWTEDNPRDDSFYVQQYIDPNATQVTFTIHHAVAAATSYVDDARVISEPRSKLYIGHLGLAQNRPHQIFMEPSYYSQEEDWIKLHGCRVDNNGYLYIPTSYPSDYRLRIRGIGYLDFLASGVSSTTWEATIAIDQPQLDILVAQATLYLYTWMSMPNYESGTREQYQLMMAFWKDEVASRKALFGMKSPGATTNWGIN